jgi:hypothetical protein
MIAIRIAVIDTFCFINRLGLSIPLAKTPLLAALFDYYNHLAGQGEGSRI